MGKKRLAPIWCQQCNSQLFVLQKSQAALALEAGVGRTYMSKIINGRLRPSDDLIKRISEILHVDPALYDA